MVILLSESTSASACGERSNENVAAGSRRGSGARPTDTHPRAPNESGLNSVSGAGVAGTTGVRKTGRGSK